MCARAHKGEKGEGVGDLLPRCAMEVVLYSTVYIRHRPTVLYSTVQFIHYRSHANALVPSIHKQG